MEILIFILASVLRLVLVIVNRHANDNHIEVVTRLLSGLPVDRSACWECFQPKFYHASVALLSYLLGLNTLLSITVLGELLNAIVGIASIIIIWKFIREQKSGAVMATFCLGLVALNPMFVGMNVQATNDTFVIFFGIASLFCLLRFLSQQTWLRAVLFIFTVVGALISKGSGVTVVLAAVVLLILQIIGALAKKRPIKLYLITVFILGASCVLSAIFLAPYYSYYQKYHDPFVINWTKPPLPDLINPTYSPLYRPGIITVMDGFFNFRFISLLQYPSNTHGSTHYPLHRTSFWSQVYGSSQSVFFDAWENTSLFAKNQTRIIFILALLPAVLFITGIGIVCRRLLLSILKQRAKALYTNNDLVIVVYFFLFLLMLLYYTYIWRDYSHMKAIFLYPALLSSTYLLHEGMNFYRAKLQRSKLLKIGSVMICMLLLFYCINIVTLFWQLSPNLFSLFLR